MSESKDSSQQVLAEITAYRDRLITTTPTPYRSGYLDGLNMAMFFVQAAIHRNQLELVFPGAFDRAAVAE